jgi:cyclin H
MRLNEDDLYRQSTQYKHWSFTPAELTRLREKTNAHAAAQVKLHTAQDRAERAKLSGLDAASAPDSGADTPNGNGAGTGANTPVPAGEVDCLTMAEEKMVVDKFCETAMKLGDFLKLQPDVSVCSSPAAKTSRMG